MAEIENPVLAVIDIQNGFRNKHTNHVIQNVDVLIRGCQHFLIPIVFTRFFNTVGSPYETLIGWDKVHSAPETDIVDEFFSFAETLIDKNFYSALTDDFKNLIEEHQWKTLVLCGIATESCVLITAADAFELGLRPIVISNACASDMGETSHLAGLLALQSLIGKNQIMTIHDFIAHINDRISSR